MKTVLFAWELGAGSGHLMNFRRLALRLRSPNVRLVAAVTRLDSIAVLDDVIGEIHRMPNWRTTSSDRRSGPASSATLNDILVDAGLADAVRMQKALEAWDRLFRAINPDLVIADFAPAASLAARHRVPLLMTGSGFTLPPHDAPEFPPLHELHAPVHREEDTLAEINAALRKQGLRALDRLPQLFAGDDCLLHTLPLLDPYARYRRMPADGPLLDRVPRGRAAGAREVFVYLSEGVAVRNDVVAALRRIAGCLRIHAPELAEDARTDLARRGAIIEPQRVDVAELLPQCRLVVHLGGIGLAAEALLAGIPQFTLVMHVEQHLTGLALERAGIGRLFTAYDDAQTLLAHALADMMGAERTVLRAADVGTQCRATFAADAPFRKFDRACEQLLG
jgi:UDP:flavonoid glycosyltransferase YjiC (YdhE family)